LDDKRFPLGLINHINPSFVVEFRPILSQNGIAVFIFKFAVIVQTGLSGRAFKLETDCFFEAIFETKQPVSIWLSPKISNAR